jgi:pyruvate formate lyase activating enzyme
MIEIGGFVPFSLNDFPGHPASVVFTRGCNYCCPYCHNAQLIPEGPGTIDPANVLAHLDKRRAVINAVVITGGEPTLQPNLPAFCRILKKRRLIIKLDTNGSRPEVLLNLLDEHLIDFFAMDLKTTPAKYSLCGKIADFLPVLESIRILTGASLPGLFRTTMCPEVVAEADLPEILSLIPSGYPHIVQACRE